MDITSENFLPLYEVRTPVTSIATITFICSKGFTDVFSVGHLEICEITLLLFVNLVMS